ncbi:hypothetical protein LCGC14_1541750 [marine sediment metagenome]|uniref:HTH gntR-type domain-containing protein n=1 Tax=marine sediment metagenome TaxID=412755 RepID=A0A0F9JDT5_9ZZZZ
MRDSKSVKRTLFEAICSQAYPPGVRLESIQQLAAAHGTSKTTVSKALKELEAEGRLERGPGRGYFVPRGGPMAPSRPGTIGFLVGSRHESEPIGSLSPGHRDTLGGMQEVLLAGNRSLLVMGGLVDDGGKPAEFPLDALRARHLEGLLTSMVYRVRYLVELSAVFPAMAVLDMDASDLGIDSVTFDNLGSAVKIMRLLVADGARRIAFVGGPFPFSPRTMIPHRYDPCARERLDGWRLGLAGAGFQADPALVRLTQQRQPAIVRQVVLDMVAEGVRPDAVLTEFPFDVVRALEQAGVSPSEGPVAGWTYASTPREDLRGIRYAALCDFERLGRMGIDMLLRRLEKPDKPVERELIEPGIVDAEGVPVETAIVD